MGYYLHWPLDEIMCLEHGDRQSFIGEISRINKEVSRKSDEPVDMFADFQ